MSESSLSSQVYYWNKPKIRKTRTGYNAHLGSKLCSRSWFCVATRESANRPSGYSKARYKETWGSCPMGCGSMKLSPPCSHCWVYQYPCKHQAKPEPFHSAAFQFSNYSGTNCFKSRGLLIKTCLPLFCRSFILRGHNFLCQQSYYTQPHS